MRVVWAVLLCGLTGCSNFNPTPPLQTLLPIPTSGWAITQSSLVPEGQMVPLGSPSFAFPQCASASTCWISYVELAYTTPLAGSALRLDYEIVATPGTVFLNDSPGNTCTPNTPTLSLLIHHGPDTGLAPGQDQNRWFSLPRAVLAVGSNSLVVPLQENSWQTDYNDGNAAGWSAAIANPSSIGIGLGGGCFVAHGVATPNGVAQLNVLGYQVVP
jgi:hypothetical protein